MYPLAVASIVASPALRAQIEDALAEAAVQVVFEQRGIPDLDSLRLKLERIRPDVLLLETAELPWPLNDLIGRIRSAAPGIRVIALNESTDPEVILDAVRAGAAEFLYPPIDGKLNQALQRVADEQERERAGSDTRGKLMAFLSVKGGCGATTLACQTAEELQKLGDGQTLLADCDAAAGVVAYLLHLEPRYGLADAVKNLNRLDVSLWNSLITPGPAGLHVLPSAGPSTSAIEDHSKAMSQLLRFMRMHYRYVVADLGHGITPETVNSLQQADDVVLVTTMDVVALRQAKQVLGALGAGTRQRVRLVLNRMDKRSEITAREIEDVLGEPAFSVIPNDWSSLQRAAAEGRPSAEGAFKRRLAELAQKLAGAAQPPKKRKFWAFA